MCYNLTWVFSGSIRSLHCPVHIHCSGWEWCECGERWICDCSQQRRSWLVLDCSKRWAGRFCSQWLCVSSTCHTRYGVESWESLTLGISCITKMMLSMIICFFSLHKRSSHFTYPIIYDLSVEIIWRWTVQGLFFLYGCSL